MCDAVMVLAKKLALISSWDNHHLPMVNETMRIVVKAVLTCHQSAPEGCSSAQEIFSNLSNALAVLRRAEKLIRQNYRYNLKLFKSYLQLNEVPAIKESDFYYATNLCLCIRLISLITSMSIFCHHLKIMGCSELGSLTFIC